MARKFAANLHVDTQGEEGMVLADDATGSVMDNVITLLSAHPVWSRIGKIDTIPA